MSWTGNRRPPDVESNLKRRAESQQGKSAGNGQGPESSKTPEEQKQKFEGETREIYPHSGNVAQKKFSRCLDGGPRSPLLGSSQIRSPPLWLPPQGFSNFIGRVISQEPVTNADSLARPSWGWVSLRWGLRVFLLLIKPSDDLDPDGTKAPSWETKSLPKILYSVLFIYHVPRLNKWQINNI